MEGVSYAPLTQKDAEVALVGFSDGLEPRLVFGVADVMAQHVTMSRNPDIVTMILTFLVRIRG